MVKTMDCIGVDCILLGWIRFCSIPFQPLYSVAGDRSSPASIESSPVFIGETDRLVAPSAPFVLSDVSMVSGTEASVAFSSFCGVLGKTESVCDNSWSWMEPSLPLSLQLEGDREERRCFPVEAVLMVPVRWSWRDTVFVSLEGWGLQDRSFSLMYIV